MSRVFADTFYFLALLNKHDEAHQRAVEHAEIIEQLVTTWILIELADALASSRHRNVFLQTRNELLADANVRVVPFESQHYESGIELYSNRADKAWSLTDCISFCVMERDGIREALTGDHHFEQAGFVALLR